MHITPDAVFTPDAAGATKFATAASWADIKVATEGPLSTRATPAHM